MLEPGTIVADRYRVQRALGHGAYGAVYQVARLDSEALVALKIMHERLGDDSVGAERFTREAKMLRELRHPNIVQLLDFGTTEGDLPFIAFELLTGKTLRDHIDRMGPMPTQDCAKLTRQVLSALSAAHAQAIVHRDIKPENVFLCDAPTGMVKLLDFGIAKAVESEQTKLTGTGQMVGTPRYMPPEQVRGQTVDARSDIYAVGAVLAEALTGSPLVSGDSQIDIFVNHLSDEPLPLSPALVSSPLGDVVRRAVAKAPDERFQSAAEMAAALDAVAPSTAMRAPEPTAILQSASVHPPAPSAPTGTSRRTIAIGGAIGALTLALGIGIGVSLSGGGGNTPSKKRKKKKTNEPAADKPKSKKRKKKKKKQKDSPSEPAAPSAPKPSTLFEIPPARIRTLLEGEGYTITGEEIRIPSQGVGVASFEFERSEMDSGMVTMTYSEYAQVIESYRKQTYGKGVSQRIRGRTIILVMLPFGDHDALARKVEKLHPKKK